MTDDLEERRRGAPWLSDERPVLEHWAGCYDRVFFALHPFHDQTGSRTMPLSEVGRRCGSPGFETMVWTTFLMASAGVSSRTIDLNPYRFPEFADQSLMDRIEALSAAESLALPEDGALPASLAPSFAHAFEAIGAEALVATHHVEESARRITTADLRVCDARTGKPMPNWLFDRCRPNVIHDEDCRMLIACQPMGCTETMIAIREDVAAAAKLDSVFEGLWAAPSTRAGWMDDVENLRPPAGFEPT